MDSFIFSDKGEDGGVLCALPDEIWQGESADGAETSNRGLCDSLCRFESQLRQRTLYCLFCQFLPVETDFQSGVKRRPLQGPSPNPKGDGRRSKSLRPLAINLL
ncbi:hypothetical protein AVEN_99568-1 [Araneus ventricosus]|uniref:Uncharacterized protein n=1 Tax=Araneus ventricosus TaxID=182803 RepID=A0A4Y2IC95_ARAVE|nr:hypothetical protein AVEN_99568-1 [Araneus ventricosus]